MKRAKYEPLESFEEAIEAESQRSRNPRFFKQCPQYFWNFLYILSSYYHLQWDRYLQFYSRDRFFALSLYELSSYPLDWIQRIYEFLGVTSTFVPSCKRFNASDYPPLAPSTKARLDSHFQKVISATNSIAGRDLQLTKL